ncbi:amidohydrolase family protein [Limnoglobus roseus]|uniref:Amidohydrolase n=1 Tax=Limnoglobus roseus TaxID=2598579 RepID=A0A5C1A5P4_9BACT|nr:amidohydrolase family protein [Limnoglobus roseus]QEL14479.1 amidohydrolase [Limnoglobus roseus]
MNLTRREWLATTAAATLTVPATAADAKPTIVDTHTHFYDPTRTQGVPWPAKDDKLLYRRVLPAEYRKLAEPLGITGTVVVEASPWVEDNQWLLDLAKDEPFILGVVGRLIPTEMNFVANLDRFAKNPLFRGIRVTHDEVKKALTDDTVAKNLQAFSDRRLTLDVNGGPELLPDIVKLSKKFTSLTIVVNHMANPKIDGKAADKAYRENLAAAAEGRNVWCKFSALVDGTRKRDGSAPTDLDFYRPTLDAVWAAFGELRLMFGSNWPVSDYAAKLETTVSLATKYVTEKAGDPAKVFATNAKLAYQLTRG